MSNFNLPEVYKLPTDRSEIKLETYDDRISSSWDIDISYSDFVDICNGFGVQAETESFLQSAEDFTEGQYHEVIEEDFQNPVFFVVYTPDYSISWEDGGTQNEVGIVSKSAQHLVDFYELTTDSDLTSEVKDNIAEIFDTHVNS